MSEARHNPCPPKPSDIPDTLRRRTKPEINVAQNIDRHARSIINKAHHSPTIDWPDSDIYLARTNINRVLKQLAPERDPQFEYDCNSFVKKSGERVTVPLVSILGRYGT